MLQCRCGCRDLLGTRHPIYTGMTGMLIGTALVNGGGLWLFVMVAGVAIFLLKIRMEEKLMLATFGDTFTAY
ncbi:MAG: methyltransferase family protein [Candidatus Xenobia bacterium]